MINEKNFLENIATLINEIENENSLETLLNLTNNEDNNLREETMESNIFILNKKSSIQSYIDDKENTESIMDIFENNGYLLIERAVFLKVISIRKMIHNIYLYDETSNVLKELFRIQLLYYKRELDSDIGSNFEERKKLIVECELYLEDLQNWELSKAIIENLKVKTISLMKAIEMLIHCIGNELD